MPRQTTQLVNGEIYHISLRAVGDTEIFKDENDYYRGIFSAYEFNNKNFVEILKRRRDRVVEKKREKSGGSPRSAETRDMMVEIWVFVFMPNHVHFVLKQLKDGGVSQFMQKFGGGYANYFNKKYVRNGHLFNQFRAVHIKDDDQLKNVFVYDHANPISLVEPGWKERGVINAKKVMKFLKDEYRWSSFFDYIGEKNFPSVTQRDFISEIMGGEKGCKEALAHWIKYKEFKNFDDLELE